MASISLRGTVSAVSATKVDPFTLNMSTLNSDTGYVSGLRSFVNVKFNFKGTNSALSMATSKLARLLKTPGSTVPVLGNSEVLGEVRRMAGLFGYNRLNITEADLDTSGELRTTKSLQGTSFTAMELDAKGNFVRSLGFAGSAHASITVNLISLIRMGHGLSTKAFTISPEAVGELKRVLGLSGDTVAISEIEASLNQYKRLGASEVLVGSIGEAVVIMERPLAPWSEVEVRAIYHTDYRVKGVVS